jgi:hypothetical protein
MGSLCRDCAALGLSRADFEQPPFIPEGKYYKVVLHGTIEQLQKSEPNCRLCSLVLHALRRNEGATGRAQTDGLEWQVQWLQNTFEYDPITNEAEMKYGSALYPVLTIPGATQSYGIQLIDEPSTTDILRGRMVGKTVDLERVRSWITACKEKHGQKCGVRDGAFLGPPDPLLCINVQQNCLEDLEPSHCYVALSYVWGENNEPQTRNHNVTEFRKPGAFTSTQLPQTIVDAIAVTKALNYRYLWVDSLCIIQDRTEEKLKLINAMSSIYGNAELTIIAASGKSVQESLSGWRPETRPDMESDTVILAPDLRVGILPFFDLELMDCSSASRGWTYQEGVLSRRCLVFLNGHVFFSCQADVWREDIMAETDELRPFEGANTLGRSSSEWPLRRFSQHVEVYTSRNLTHDKDIGHAFAGIQANLATSMANTRFWYGLPASAFDWALLWSATDTGMEARREGFPTWSWMSLKKRVLLPVDHWSEFDQKWLRERTWINWYVVHDDCIVPIWDPKRDQTVLNAEIEMLEEENDGEETIQLSDDADEDEEELESCPQYGSPEHNNPYGRKAQSHMEFIAVYSSHQSDNQLAIPLRIPEVLKFPCLYFWTLRCVYYLEPASFIDDSNNISGDRENFFVLKGSKRDSAASGLVHLQNAPSIADSKPFAATVEILVMSYAAPGNCSAFPIEKLKGNETNAMAESSTVDEEKTDAELVINELHRWNRLNILVVCPSQGRLGVVERLGVGVLMKDAIADSVTQPNWSSICLA